jgi:peptidoglycan/xylan/chitin deacetylase (PgdA/CDA1 family)
MTVPVAVLAPSAPGPVAAALVARLARHPSLDVSVVVDDSAPAPGTPLAPREALRRAARGLAQRVFELMHPSRDERVEDVALRAGARAYRVGALRGAEAGALLRGLRPAIAVVLGDVVPSAATLTAAHTVVAPGAAPTDDRGTPALIVGAHRVTSEGALGDALVHEVVPVDVGDTEASVAIKADLVAAELCERAVRRLVDGPGAVDASTIESASATPSARAMTLPHAVRRLRRVLRDREPVMRAVWPRRRWPVQARLLAQYAAMLPLLRRTRARLVREARAPVCIFFYHLVANRPLNHLCLPLEAFVAQVAFLRRYFAIVSLEQAVERVRAGKNEAICAALTFDDGYHDNGWAIRYLNFLGVPAAFFVSIGHVLDGTAFAHDRRRGHDGARPMSDADVRRLSSDGFLVASHALHHEDFGELDDGAAARVLRESRELVSRVSGQAVHHFSFPRGQRGVNITEAALRLAMQEYPYVYSAYGGYNLPATDRRHFVRLGAPVDVLDLAMTMDGYRGLRACLRGDAWGVRSHDAPPWRESAA